MTQHALSETPIEELNPGWIGMPIEVDDLQGVAVGFRLARYERTMVDNTRTWILYSDGSPWRTEVRAGAKVRWVGTVPAPGQFVSPQPAPPHSAVTALPQQAQLSPQSWVTPTPGGNY
ncbi:hypothetical protein [Streptomyces sp. NEAU-174]|uniref:hypothetical protein n=1 Tax=Streptomyces sp. NEAU-174 TaxID=3458254 RepID=UPI0040443EFF